jgi:hypothetical protein
MAVNSGDCKDGEAQHPGNVFWGISLSQKILTNLQI